MRAPWRPLVLAAALNVIVVAAAAAQTVIVTKAPPGGTVELVVNSVLAGTATADSTGMATIALTPEARGGKTEADAYVFVEYCDTLRRVILIEPGMQGLPGGQCPRREVPGAFVVRQMTTLVVNVSETAPSVLVRQGKAPAAWLTDEVDRPPSPKAVNSPSRGLYGFGAGGIASLSGVRAVVCGTGECTGGTKPAVFSAGATFWLKPFLGIEASWLKPTDIRLTGATNAYEYVSTFQTDVFTMVGKLGVPVSYVRPYGFGGATWNRAHWTTTQTITEQTYTIDGADGRIPRRHADLQPLYAGLELDRRGRHRSGGRQACVDLRRGRLGWREGRRPAVGRRQDRPAGVLHHRGHPHPDPRLRRLFGGPAIQPSPARDRTRAWRSAGWRCSGPARTPATAGSPGDGFRPPSCPARPSPTPR